jgi:ATP-dependent DNA helicase PIF1
MQKASWAQSATELRGTQERLNFLVRGTKKQESASVSKLAVEPERGVAKIFLSKEQQVVFEKVCTHRKSIFFTGSAGTGKSVVLRQIIKGLRSKFSTTPDVIAVTASTGIAACNIGGTTLHSFAGAGLCEGPINTLLPKIRKNRKSLARWMRTKVLIIDEVSMISPDLLDKLEEIARLLRRSPKPFGGIQVVMTGDFFQLPPVERNTTETRYAFDAQCWDRIAEVKINLTQVFRQKDPVFVNMLNELRFGRPSPSTIKMFAALTGESETQKASKLSPTILFPMRREVEQANAMELLKIKRPSYTFDSIDEGTAQGDFRQKLLEHFMAPAKLHLKIGCQVMLIKNTDTDLVNGSIGTVVAFLTAAEWLNADYSFFDWDQVDTTKMSESDIQGAIQAKYRKTRMSEREMTSAEKEILDATRPSRNTALGEGAGAQKSRADLAEAIRKEESRERSRSRSASPERREAPRLPVVRFLLSGNPASATKPVYRTHLVTRETWKNEMPNGEVMVSRTQVPLILAWAMSIHKSQGQTLPLVKIDLNKTFEKGQAYVALSRATTPQGLQVIGFHPSKVRVDNRVVEWYKTLPVVKA